MTTKSEINEAKVRSGHCWEDDAVLDVALEIVSCTEWVICPQCDKRWRLLTDSLIVERIPLPVELHGKPAGGFSIGETTFVCDDGTKLLAFPGDAWEIPEKVRYIELLWPSARQEALIERKPSSVQRFGSTFQR